LPLLIITSREGSYSSSVSPPLFPSSSRGGYSGSDYSDGGFGVTATVVAASVAVIVVAVPVGVGSHLKVCLISQHIYRNISDREEHWLQSPDLFVSKKINFFLIFSPDSSVENTTSTICLTC